MKLARYWKLLALVLALSGCAEASSDDARNDAGVESHAEDAREAEISDGGELEVEYEIADTAVDARYCMGEPIRCGGSMCCTPEALAALFAAGWPGADALTYTFFDAWRMFRVDESNVSFLPALRGWSWRGDGSEVVLVGWLSSPRCEAGCFNWCFPGDRALIVVIDVETSEVAHAEFLTRWFDWRVHFNAAGHRCPASLGSSHYCRWVEVPERGVGYSTYGGYIGYYEEEERFMRDPVIRGMIRVYPLPLPDPPPYPAPRTIDVRVPEVLDWVRVCNISDPGDAAP